MINKIKYFPLKFRARTPDPEVERYSIKTASTVKINISGCILEISLPKHKSQRDAAPYVVTNPNANTHGFQNYTGGSVASDNWQHLTFLRRSWAYWAAWFTGREGELIFTGSILKRADGKQFRDVSYFHPRGFEFATSNFLNTRYGFKEDQGSALYNAPVNWRTFNNLPVFSACFDVKGSNESLIYMFPISKQSLVKVEFRYLGTNPKMRENMESLARDIINSVTLELSEETQAELDSVKSETDDMSLSENFAPLKWPIKPEDIEKPPLASEQNGLR